MNKHLTTYVEGKNLYRRLFGKPVMDPKNLTALNVKDLLEEIESDLSPENLTCDGELTGRRLHTKYTMIIGAQTALRSMQSA